MIKVIKQGDMPPKKFTCPACGCEFEAGREDYSVDEIGLGYYKYSCQCPCCKSEVTIF